MKKATLNTPATPARSEDLQKQPKKLLAAYATGKGVVYGIPSDILTVGFSFKHE